jgi:hypothetical protein
LKGYESRGNPFGQDDSAKTGPACRGNVHSINGRIDGLVKTRFLATLKSMELLEANPQVSAFYDSNIIPSICRVLFGGAGFLSTIPERQVPQYYVILSKAFVAQEPRRKPGIRP